MSRRDEQVFAEFLQGEVGAFTEIVGRYEKVLFSYFYRHVGRRDEAQVLVQETFERIFLYRRSYDERRSFRTWVFTVASNRYRDWLREEHREREKAREAKAEAEGRGANVESPEKKVLDDDRRQIVRQALESLPSHHRDVLFLKHFEAMRYEEIAKLQDCSVGTIKSRMHHAVRKIRERLEACGLIKPSPRRDEED